MPSDASHGLIGCRCAPCDFEMVDVTHARHRAGRSPEPNLRAIPEQGGTHLGGTIALVPPNVTTGLVGTCTFLASDSLLEAEAVLREQHGGAGPLKERGAFAFRLGCVLRAQGRVVSALKSLREALAVAVLYEPRTFGYEAACLAELAHSVALLGEVEMAEALVSGVSVARDQPFGPVQHHIVLAHVWIAAARGEVSSGLATALEWASRPGSVAWDSWRGGALHEVARLGRPRCVAARLEKLEKRSGTPVSRTYAEHARSLCVNDGDALLAVSRSFEMFGMLLFAAEAAAEAFVAYRRNGRTGSALTAREIAGVLAGRCEGARTPALTQLESLPLTPREREVATLAARGLSNGEIAERLVASVRTIDNHLHRAFEKLGIHGRGELASLLL